MSSITVSTPGKQYPQIRPLSVFRDLPAVADLIELCFSSTMDSDGKRYIQDMRRAGADSISKWATRAAESTTLPLSGFVWDEDGKIIGNTSLVPFRHQGQRIYLIANVAVHPDHRRRGIAKALTQHAMQHAREKKADVIWLHVRDDNPGAIDLYKQLGFVEHAKRTSWQASTDAYATLQTDITVTKRNPNEWPMQLSWLKRLYPEALSWHRSWNFNSLRPGLWNWLYLLFVDMSIRQWSAYRRSSFEAALAWIPSGRGESLFAAIGERSRPESLTALLLQARRDLVHSHPKLIMEFPVGEFDPAIQAAGFAPLRTLIWMRAT